MHIFKNGNKIHYSEFLLGTDVTLTLYKETHIEVVRKIFELVLEYQNRFSFFYDNSELSHINKTAYKENTPLSDEMYYLLSLSKLYSNDTLGFFNPYLGLVQSYWMEKRELLFEDGIDEISKIAGEISSGDVVLEKGNVRYKRPEIMIDLGGIAKGYILGQSSRLAISLGIDEFVLSLGGDLYVFSKGNSRVFEVAIPNPRNRSEAIITISAQNVFITTSGTYERFFEFGGEVYSHIINPYTGIPITGLKSCTVVTNDPILADVLSTTLLIAPQEIRQFLIKKFQPLKVIYIDGEEISQY